MTEKAKNHAFFFWKIRQNRMLALPGRLAPLLRGILDPPLICNTAVPFRATRIFVHKHRQKEGLSVKGLPIGTGPRGGEGGSGCFHMVGRWGWGQEVPCDLSHGDPPVDSQTRMKHYLPANYVCGWILNGSVRGRVSSSRTRFWTLPNLYSEVSKPKILLFSYWFFMQIGWREALDTSES